MRLRLIATAMVGVVGLLQGCFLMHGGDGEGEPDTGPEPVDAAPDRADAAPEPEPDPPGRDYCPSEPPEGECPCGVAERYTHPDATDGTCFVCHPCTEGCEVPHEDDGPMLSGSGAHLSWQAPGGAAGYGPAITVTEDGTGGGTLRVWDTAVWFEPASTPDEPPDETVELSFVELDQLFLRLEAADTDELPHDGPAAECYPIVYARECESCPVLRIEYSTADQVRPELDCVAEWIATQLPEGSRSPAAHCDL